MSGEALNDFVLWLDPGETTGIACYDSVLDEMTWHQYDFARTGEYLSMQLCVGGRSSVSWERFTISADTAKKSPAPWSLEVIGMTRWIVLEMHHQRDGCPKLLAPAYPADRHLGKREWLETLGWWPGASKPHACDAMQHMLAWMLRERTLPEQYRKKLFTNAH